MGAQIAAQLRNLTNRTLTEAMTRSVLIVEGNAKREAPVKTGNLRRTITSRVEQGGKRGVIGTNAPYARPVSTTAAVHTSLRRSVPRRSIGRGPVIRCARSSIPATSPTLLCHGQPTRVAGQSSGSWQRGAIRSWAV
jgi:hypothetical protein